MSNNPVRQHWVPRVYLRAFCAATSDREQLHVCDLASRSTYLASIERVAVKKHFYTLGRETDEPSYAVEQALADLESEVAPILSEVLGDGVLPTDQSKLAVLARFLATLHMRTRQGLQIIYGHREEVRTGSAPGGSRMSGEAVGELLGMNEEQMRELFAGSCVAVGARLGERLLGMHWQLLQAEDDYFVTSENPIFSYHSTEERWGLGTPGAHTFCPLSPTLLLHVGAEQLMPGVGTFPLPKEGVRGVNGLIVLAAEQYVYSHRPLDDVADLLQGRPVGSRRAFGPAT